MSSGAASIVNDLIRAAASIPKDISDAELDKHVADLLVKEAKAKESRWKELGIGVYLDSVRDETSGASALPRPNKRFLSSVIRQVDDHNTALLREQALAAQEASRDLPVASGSRDRTDSRPQERGSQPKQPVGAARLFGGALGAARSSKNRQTEVEARRDNRRERSPRRSQDFPSEQFEFVRRKGDDDRSSGSTRRDEKGRRRERESSQDREQGATRRRSPCQETRRDRDGEGRRRSPRRERSRSPFRLEDGDLVHRKGELPSSSQAERSVQQKDASNHDREDASTLPIQSKMDRYFEESYNPQLDLTGVLPIPSSGLVPDVGWDNMLAVLKEKGKKRRATSPGLSQSPPPESSRRRRRSVSPTRRKSERSGRSSSKKEGKKGHRRRDHSPASELSYDDSEASEDRERRKRKKRKEKEKKRAAEEEEDKRKYGGYVYARPGSTRAWDVGKADMSF